MNTMPRMTAIMTPFPHTVDLHESLGRAEGMMMAAKIRHLPVTDMGKLVGILSDRDVFLAKAVSARTDFGGELTVGDVCTLEPFIVDVDDRLDSVVNEMSERRIGSALITRNDKLVGIFTTTDVCRELADLLRRHYPDA